MKLLLFLAPVLAACGLTAPPRPDQSPAREWNLAQTEMPGSWHGAKLTWDATRGGVVMYGGRHATGDTENGKVYIWHSNSWTEICNGNTAADPAPTPRYLPGFAWNPMTNQLVLAGGARDGSKFQDLSTEVWTCDDSANKWVHVSEIATARAGADLVWNDEQKRLMLIGGRDKTRQLRSIEMTVDDVNWTPYPTELPFDCAGAGQSVTYDTSAHIMFALAGELSAGFDEPNTFHDEIWQLSGPETEWFEICEQCSGIPRTDASIVHLGGDTLNDTNENYVIGGYVGNGEDTYGTWLIDNNQLIRIRSIDIQKRNGVGVAWDGIRDTLVAFGGVGPSCPQRFDGECDQTYEYIRK